MEQKLVMLFITGLVALQDCCCLVEGKGGYTQPPEVLVFWGSSNIYSPQYHVEFYPLSEVKQAVVAWSD